MDSSHEANEQSNIEKAPETAATIDNVVNAKEENKEQDKPVEPNPNAEAISKAYEEEQKSKYLGLSNQGATCYMNSLLQSLFMTQQFRQKIFEWKYDESTHGPAKDCLPLQLQILFARLQSSSNSNHSRSYVDTKALIDTFGWTSSQMFEQQDVQEFCRVFFDAIEQALNEGSTKDSQWLRDLYEGQTENFIHCKTCLNDSVHINNFLDLQLIIRSEFDQISNNSLEKCLKHLVKSAELSHDNQYFCEQCSKKVDATMGVRFKEVPPVLMLQLNRYDLDYTTFMRKKICDRVYFPVILNLNEFFKQYDEIVVEEPPSPKRVQETTSADAYSYGSVSNRKVLSKRKASTDLTTPIAEKTTEGADADIEDLFASKTCVSTTNKRPRTKSEERAQQTKEESKGTSSTKDNQKKERESRENEEESIQQESPMDFALFGDIDVPAAKKQSTVANDHAKKNKNLKVQVNPALISKIDEIYEVAGEYDEGDFDDTGIYWGTDMKLFGKRLDQVAPNKSSQSSKTDQAENRRLTFEENYVANVENAKAIEKYLKDGPNVYELYAVNVHSGGAQGGHYFSYIKSFENGQWYNFNDSNVSLISESTLQRVQGDTNSTASHNTSAYMLMYKKVDLEQANTCRPQIPEDIVKTLEADERIEEQKREVARAAAEAKANQIDIRVYKDFENSVSFSFNRKETTLEMVKLKVLEQFNVTCDLSCWRLRGYSFVSRMLTDSYEGKEQIALSELSIQPNLIIETKAPNEEFEDYDPLKIALLINIWKDGQNSLENIDQPLTVPTKLMIRETKKIKSLIKRISKITQIDKEDIVLLKKSNRTLNFIMMCVNDCESSMNSTLTQLDIFNNSQLYVEKRKPSESSTSSTSSTPSQEFDWGTYMERQSHICKIAFNTPQEQSRRAGSSFEHEITLDNRCTLRDAKNLMSKKLNIPTSQFVMRKTSLRNQEELKDLSVQVQHIGILNRGTLFLSLGTPSQIDEFNVEYRMCVLSTETSELNVVGIYESSFLFNYNTPTYLTVLELKQVLLEKLVEKGIAVKSAKHIRLRVRLSEFKGIMKNDKSLREYQLYDRKVLGVSILEEPEDLKANQIVVCVKEWDSETRFLKAPVEVVVETGCNNREFIKAVAKIMCGGKGVDPNELEVYLHQQLKSQASLEMIAYDSVNWKSNSDSFSISHSPWFLNRDGELVIARIEKDFSENKEIIEEYLKKLSQSSAEADSYLQSKVRDPKYFSKDDSSVKSTYKQKAEVALKINLKKNKVDTNSTAASSSSTNQQPIEETQEGTVESENNNNKPEASSSELEAVAAAATTSSNEQQVEEVSACYPPQSDVDEKIVSQLAAQQEQQQCAETRVKQVRFGDESIPAEYYEDDDDELQRILLASLREYEASNNSTDATASKSTS